MEHASSTFLQLISRALRANYDAVAREPLPERWVDLIHRLNDRERRELDQPSRVKPHGRAH
jgi:hypothetical protein